MGTAPWKKDFFRGRVTEDQIYIKQAIIVILGWPGSFENTVKKDQIEIRTVRIYIGADLEQDDFYCRKMWVIGADFFFSCPVAGSDVASD